VGQIVNLRRIGNPPAGEWRAAELPSPAPCFSPCLGVGLGDFRACGGLVTSAGFH